MPILQELKKTVTDDIISGVIETIIDVDEMFKMLPFRHTVGAGLKVTWENSIPEATFIDPLGSIPQSSGTTLTQFTETIKVIARDIDIPNYAMQVMGADPSIMVQGEIKAIARAYKKNTVVGDESTNPNTFNGLAKQVSKIESLGVQRSVDATGNTLTFKLLDDLLKLMKMGADAIIMHPETYVAYKELLRQSGGGTDSAMLQLPNLGRPVLSFEGIPILKNENIPIRTVGGNVVTDIYAVVFDENSGVTGLYSGDNAGISYQILGQAQDKDATRYRFKWYCGFTVLNPYAIAVVKNIKVA